LPLLQKSNPGNTSGKEPKRGDAESRMRSNMKETKGTNLPPSWQSLNETKASRKVPQLKAPNGTLLTIYPQRSKNAHSPSQTRTYSTHSASTQQATRPKRIRSTRKTSSDGTLLTPHPQVQVLPLQKCSTTGSGPGQRKTQVISSRSGRTSNG